MTFNFKTVRWIPSVWFINRTTTQVWWGVSLITVIGVQSNKFKLKQLLRIFTLTKSDSIILSIDDTFMPKAVTFHVKGNYASKSESPLDDFDWQCQHSFICTHGEVWARFHIKHQHGTAPSMKALSQLAGQNKMVHFTISTCEVWKVSKAYRTPLN